MSVFSENIRVLRVRQNLSQQKLADNLLITRGRYVKYEDGSSEPPYDILIRISKYFKISIDLLVTVDLRKYPLDNMMEIANNRILFPVSVDGSGENKIEIVTEKASMGYLSGYTDPQYIENLQTISLPFLKNGKYRAFPAGGDSMPPFRSGTYIVGKYVENLESLKSGKTYIFITKTEGITYKRFQERMDSKILVKADNNFYQPYEIEAYDLEQIWEYACSIITDEFATDDFLNWNIKEMFSELKNDIVKLNRKIEKK